MVDHQSRVIYVSERASGFLRLRTGELSAQLLHLVAPELRLALRAAIAQSQQTAAVVHARRTLLKHNDKVTSVSMTVRPASQLTDAAS